MRSTGCRPPPLYTPLLPPPHWYEIGERYCQTISNSGHTAGPSAEDRVPTPPPPLYTPLLLPLVWDRRGILPNHSKFRTCSALVPMWTHPINESAELTQGALTLGNSLQYSELWSCTDGICVNSFDTDKEVLLMKIWSGSHNYILFQGGFFMSMFFALRGMATAPVPSMTSGGLYWFTGRTVCIASHSLAHYFKPILTCHGWSSCCKKMGFCGGFFFLGGGG